MSDQKFKIFITRKIPDAGIKLLKQAGFQVSVSQVDGVMAREDLLKKVKGMDAILPLLTDKMDGELMDAAGKQLKVIANYAVGIDNINLDDAAQRIITITNTPGVLTEAVAELAFALMISAARRIPESDQFTRKGKYKGWAPMMMLGSELHHKTLGIVGLGRIGSAVAERAFFGFKMKIIYYDVKRNEEFEQKFQAEYRGLPGLLRDADFISIHVPLISETKHLIGKNEFKIMKKTAYLINTSRGPIVDEAALVDALKKKRIAGAGLDVYENEPKLAPGLKDLPNVVLTPHTGSATIETRSAMAELAAKNIIEVLNGRAPLTPVKKP